MASSDSAANGSELTPSTSREALDERIAALESENLTLRSLAEHHSASISHLTHELRTPLTSILGFAEIMLGQEKLTDAQRNFCERIENSAKQLQRTLNQLSEVSRAIASSESKQP
jgi:signal transduction histidine kinase